MTILFLFCALILLLAIGTPVAISLGLSSILTLMLFSGENLNAIASKLFEAMEHYTLLAIPFFLLSSAFLTTGGVSQRLIRLAIAMVGHLRGGLAIASVLACMLFAAVSGSSPATVVAVGSIVIAAMVKAGYSQSFAAGVICNAGTLGILIPPSIIMVVYSAATDVSVGRMFMAGVVPGLIAGLMLAIGIYIAARITGLPRQPRLGWREKLAALRDASWGLFLIVIILGGIYGGIFTPTEAAAVAAVYGFVIAVFVYRDIGPFKARRPAQSLSAAVPQEGTAPRSPLAEFADRLMDSRDLVDTVLGAARTSVMLLFIIANAMIFSHVLTVLRVPNEIASLILDAGLAPWAFLVVVNILLLLAGNVMEPSGLLLITAPILFPIATELGIDPVHLGIIMVVNMEVGMITPPMGLNLFVTSAITGMPLLSVVRAALPWLGILLIFLMLVTYVPALSLWLPNLMFGPQL